MHFNFCKFIRYFVDLCGNEISRCNISHCISKLSQPLKASKADVALLVSNCKANTQHYPTRTALKTHITQNNNADCFLHCMRSDSILPPSFPPSLPLPHPCTQQSLPVWSACLTVWQPCSRLEKLKGCLKPFLSQSLPLVSFIVFIPIQRGWLVLQDLCF